MSRTTVRRLVITAAALVTIPLAAAPAQARRDPGPPLSAPTPVVVSDPAVVETAAPQPVQCYLERIGTQLVRCDDLTGNGVAAPAYIPEQ